MFIKHLEKVIASREPVNLYDPVNYIMTLGGKRIRPALVLMSCDLFGSDPSTALDAAMAVEMFHNFTLIHDDIMDSAELRRGKTTVHRKWDPNTGILSGDVLMILAYRQFESYPPKLFKELTELFNRTAVEVCEGQQMDMDFEDRVEVSAEEYFRMIEYKTAVLLGCALKMGSIIAGASVADQESIYAFGVNLGIAFQLQDDYLDTFGGSDFGKRIGGDILERKKTILYIRALEGAGESDREALLGHFEAPGPRPSSQDDGDQDVQERRVQAVRAIYQRSGADRLLLGEIRSYTDQALKMIGTLSLDESSKELLREFSTRLMNRKV